MVKLSVVTGTLNRLALLMPAIDSIRSSALPYKAEIIVVDGGSRDGTAEYLREQTDVHVIWQGTRLGAVKAFNAGFAVATGEYVANFNDDALYQCDALARAICLLDDNPMCGQAAIPFADPNGPAHVEYTKAGRKAKNYLYANFGVTRRWLGDVLGWWGEYAHYAGDTDLSLEIWKAGFSVLPVPDALIQHARRQDAIRVKHYPDPAFAKKWNAWNNEVSRASDPRPV